MKLLIDIGNTNTSLAVVDNGKILKRYFIHTAKERLAPFALERLIGKGIREIDTIVIVSVVPKFRSLIERNFKDIIPGVLIRIVGRDIKVPMNVNYKPPEDVGQDRLVGAFSAAYQYGTPILVIDFGTAVTFDFVNNKGEYEGGLIFPGIRLGLKALERNTALLPKIKLKETEKDFIGQDTKSSMNKGMLFGYAAMCDGIVSLFKEEYGNTLKAVATGGDAALIAKYSRCLKTIYPDLIFTGLLLLTEK